MQAIRAAWLFDGVADDVTSHPELLVDGGRIVAVGPGRPLPHDVEVLDLGDVTLLPGFVDCHVHLVFDASTDPVGNLAARDDAAVLTQARAAARRALAAGITTLRDLGDRGYVLRPLREEFAADRAAGPHLQLAGPPITTSGGHCWFLGGQADGVDGVRAAVRDHAAAGMDVIKMMVSGGAMTPGSVVHASQYGPPELRAATDEAHRLGLAITGHAWGAQGVADAVAAGFDGIEHCGFFTADGVQTDPAVIAAMAARPVFVSSTGAAAGPLAQSIYDADILRRLPDLIAAHQQMRAAGVPLAMSSDAGVTTAKPHDVLPFGADLLRRLGYSTADALRAITTLPAAACGLGDRKGRLAAGYDADLVAVTGNPLADIASMHAVAAVVRGGVRVL